MANQREVSLLISAQTAGGDKIRELAAEVERLATEGGAAAPEFKKLADELKKLEQQQGVITQFDELSRKTTETKVAFEKAAAATRASVTAMDARKAALTAAVAAEKTSSDAIAKHREEMERARLGVTTLKAELAKYKAEIAAAGKATDEQTKAIANIKTLMAQYGAAVSAAKAAIAAATPAQRANAEAVNAANNSLKQATGEFSRNQTAMSAARAEYERTATAVQKVGEQMDRLGVSSRNLGAAQQQVSAGFRQAAQEVDTLRDKATNAGGGFGVLTNFVRGAAGQITALIGAVAGLTEFVRVNVELENVNRTLTVLTGSSKAAAAEMTFIRETANRLGLELIDTSKSYAQFAAATKGTALEGEQTRKIFESVSNAMAIAGKSAADTSSALNALGQMVSKGTVSMEELRGQLGDRLPGALKAAADGLGITTSQLVKMVEDGRVLAVDLLPRLATALDQTYKSGANAGSTLQQDWNRFRNAISETAEELGRSGVISGFLELGRAVTTVAVGFGNFISVTGTLIGSTFGAMFETIGNLKDAIVNLSFDGFMEKSRIAAQVLRDTLADELDRAATSIRKFSGQSTLLEWALDKLGLGAGKATSAISKVTTATANAAVTTERANISWVKLTSIYQELTTQTEKNVQAADKAIAARKAEGDAAIAMAQAFGTEIQQRQAATAAAAANQAALEALAKQRTAELSLMQSQLAAMREWIATNKDETKERQEAIRTLEQKIAVRQEETNKVIAQAQAARLLTEASKVEQATHADNSARLGELRDAYTATAAEVDRLRLAKIAGQDVTKQLPEAELKAAKAATMYRDAISDQERYIRANASAKQQSYNLAEATIRLQIQEAQGNAEVARVLGDSRAERAANNQVRELEIELAQLQAKAMRAEAEAELELVRNKRAEMITRGELTRTAEAELKARELAAEVQKKQSDIASEVADSLRRVRDATAQVGDANNKAAGDVQGLNAALDQQASKLNQVTTAAQTAGYEISAQENRYRDFLEGRGEITEQDREYIESRNAAAQANLQLANNMSGLFSSHAIQDLERNVRESQRALETLNGQAAAATAADAAKVGPQLFGRPDAASPARQAATGAAARPTMHTVVLDFNGRETRINTASPQDSKALAEALEQLHKDMMRS